MAIFHASISAMKRSAGRSATAAAAYRSGSRIVDERSGEVHDYTRKGGVIVADLIVPGGQMPDRSQFWNQVEAHHRRADAVVARELIIALPDELGLEDRLGLARQMALSISAEYAVAVDLAVHEPSQDGDERNTHAHLLISACTVGQDGSLGKKAERLDPIHCARHKLQNLAEFVRPLWESQVNAALAQAGREERVDHRSLAAQGIDRVPTTHIGPAGTGYERRTGQPSRRRTEAEAEEQAALTQLLKERAAEAAAASIREIDQQIADLESMPEADEPRAPALAELVARLRSPSAPAPAPAQEAEDTPPPWVDPRPSIQARQAAIEAERRAILGRQQVRAVSRPHAVPASTRRAAVAAVPRLRAAWEAAVRTLRGLRQELAEATGLLRVLERRALVPKVDAAAQVEAERRAAVAQAEATAAAPELEALQAEAQADAQRLASIDQEAAELRQQHQAATAEAQRHQALAYAAELARQAAKTGPGAREAGDRGRRPAGG